MWRRGRWGERAAARHLTRRGWRILDVRWRGGGGEIDLVALRRGVLALCEVKTRSREEALAEPVTARQRDRIARAAEAYLALAAPPGLREVRLDLITVRAGGRRARVRHLPGALMAGAGAGPGPQGAG